MAIISVHQLRSFEYSESKGSKGSVDMKGSVELIAKFDGEVNFDTLVNDTTVWPGLSNSVIPQIGDAHSIGGIPFFVSSRKFGYFKGDEQERAAKITIEFDNKREEPQDPDEEKPQGTDAETWKKITVTTEQQSVPLTDEGENGLAGGEPARNSAGDPVDGLQENRCLLKLTYTNTQVRNPNFNWLILFTNRTNKTEFLGGARRTVLCQGYNAEYDDVRQLWTVSVEFLYDPEGHYVTYYDAGFNEIKNGQRRAILDIAGNPVSRPVPLHQGVAIAPATASQYAPGTANAALQKLKAYPYKEKEMNDIFDFGGI